MAQRTLDSAFWDDEDVASLTRDQRLLLICMFTDASLSDDFGCLQANPKTLKKHAFGYDDDVTTDQVLEWRNAIIAKCKNVKLYTSDDQEYIQLVKFQQWQQLRYHRKSNTPKPTNITHTEIAENCGNLQKTDGNFPLCSVEYNSVEMHCDASISSASSATSEKTDNYVAIGVKAFESVIGLVTGQRQSEEMIALLEELRTKGAESWWQTAIDIACDNNKRSWSYVRTILENHIRDGTAPTRRNGSKPIPIVPQKKIVRVKDPVTGEISAREAMI
jgi:hypothetical protein